MYLIRSMYVVGLMWCVVVVLAEDNAVSNGEDEQQPAAENKTEPTHIELRHKQSTTSSIEVEWFVPALLKPSIANYTVKSNRMDSEVEIKSPPLNEESFLIEDLRTNAEYNVCLFVLYTNDTVEELPCMAYSTVPLIRVSSLIAMSGVIGYILLMILLGYIFWRCKMNSLQTEDDEEQLNPEAVDEKEKMNPNNQPVVYLAAPPRPGERSSIEDPDIPYITPPVEQLTQSERDKFFANTRV